MSDLSDLYQEIILDHAKRPFNKGELPDATVSVPAENPTCGDEVTLQLRVADGRIEDVKFTGQGCAICMASASMMTRAVKGKGCEEAGALFQKVHDGIQGTGEMPKGEISALAGVKEFPQRVKCALLAWEALREALGIRKGPAPPRVVTTEGADFS
jgi:nitrogen fixation protein NifU and related proteins